MYCELDENKILMGYSDHPSAVGIEINKPIPAFTSTQRVKWDGSDWVVEDSQTLINAKAEYDAQEYARARRSLYPPIGDQLDDLYHAGVFSADMTAKLKKVKDDNPK